MARPIKKNFNTAVFFDIENLIGGYGFSERAPDELSLERIVHQIHQCELVHNIAVQRAYANWSDRRLATFRSEINQLGIEPVQVFGFGKQSAKNAADIQLAVDAVDLAHVREGIEVFVIVAGDGGYASLAKKLHEYGKSVVGLAFQRRTSATFHSVCDEFIYLDDWGGDDDPDYYDDRRYDGPGYASGRGDNYRPGSYGDSWNGGSGDGYREPAGGAQPRERGRESVLAAPRRPAAVIAPAAAPVPDTATDDQILEGARQIIDDLLRNDPSANAGLAINPASQALKRRHPSFAAGRFGFAKATEFFQFACAGQPFGVVRRADRQVVILPRESVQPGEEILPDLALRDPHSPEAYESILGRQPSPVIRFPSPPEETIPCLEALCGTPPSDATIGEIIENVAYDLGAQGRHEMIKAVVLALVATNILKCVFGQDLLPPERRFTLDPEYKNAPAEVLERLRQAARDKIAGTLGRVDSETIDLLVGGRRPATIPSAAPPDPS